MCLTCTAVVTELLPLLNSGVVENSCSAGAKLTAHKNHILNHLRLYLGLPVVETNQQPYESEKTEEKETRQHGNSGNELSLRGLAMVANNGG